MLHFVPVSRKSPREDDWGFDASRGLEVVRQHHTAEIGLSDCDDGVDVFVGDWRIATTEIKPPSQHEKAKKTRTVKVKGGAAGSTRLYATDGIGVIFDSLDVTVVTDRYSRRVGKDPANISTDIRQQAQGLSLRDAVMLVAEDQMNSSVTAGSGFGVYGPSKYDWCGFFVYWCWDMAAALKGVANPFGSDNWTLASPIRAVSWAMRDDSPGQVLHYEGGDEFKGGKQKQEWREFGYNGYQLERGDVVLLHRKHVCMVDSVSGNTIRTMNGNQGTGHSIKIVDRNVNDTYHGKKLYFIHVLV
jgi:hypothetical protein